MTDTERLELRKRALLAFFATDQCDVLSNVYAFALFITLEVGDVAVLKQLIKEGPIWDGDLISKAGRDTLLDTKLATKIVVKGKQGYQAATYLGLACLNSSARLGIAK